MQVPSKIDPKVLIERYDAFLFDAYGVLVHRDGALPGAVSFLNLLKQHGKPYFIVTNSAARLEINAALRYRAFGLPIEPEQIVCAGALIAPYLLSQSLTHRRCGVLGPQDSFRFVERSGACAVPVTEPFDALVIGDQVGFPFLEGMDAALSHLIRRFDQNLPIHLILPNPDLIFPGSNGFGMTCGAMARVIESVLEQRYPLREDTRFKILGKPMPALLEEALLRAGTRNAIMLGDQIETDILAAQSAGIDSALLSGGVADFAHQGRQVRAMPNFLIAGLET